MFIIISTVSKYMNRDTVARSVGTGTGEGRGGQHGKYIFLINTAAPYTYRHRGTETEGAGGTETARTPSVDFA